MIFFAVLSVTIGFALSEDAFEPNEETIQNNVDVQREHPITLLVENFVRIYGNRNLIQKMYSEGLDPVEARNAQEEITENINSLPAAYAFVQAKGIENIAIPLVNSPDVLFMENGLRIFNKLFELIPKTVKTLMPYSLLDVILRKLEQNLSPNLNRLTVEVLTHWLLKNPGAQTHVMRIKGLEPFYEQVVHLDSDVTAGLLNLFKELIKEHFSVLKEMIPTTKAEQSLQTMYKKIAFLDLLSTDKICMGLIMLYEDQLPDKDKLMFNVVELLRVTKPLCISNYRRRRQVIDFLTDIEEHVSDESRVAHFNTLRLDPAEVKSFVQQYKTQLAESFDEL